jgi:hypothetical protein
VLCARETRERALTAVPAGGGKVELRCERREREACSIFPEMRVLFFLFRKKMIGPSPGTCPGRPASVFAYASFESPMPPCDTCTKDAGSSMSFFTTNNRIILAKIFKRSILSNHVLC